ncbi:MAG: hypothetical protein ACREO9_12125, partial [Lysobacterales bacterium]
KALLDIYPGFTLASLPSAEFSHALRRADQSDGFPAEISDLYLVDPLGNIMMTYSGDAGAEKMSKDLKILLTWSNPGNRA